MCAPCRDARRKAYVQRRWRDLRADPERYAAHLRYMQDYRRQPDVKARIDAARAAYEYRKYMEEHD